MSFEQLGKLCNSASHDGLAHRHVFEDLDWGPEERASIRHVHMGRNQNVTGGIISRHFGMRYAGRITDEAACALCISDSRYELHQPLVPDKKKLDVFPPLRHFPHGHGQILCSMPCIVRVVVTRKAHHDFPFELKALANGTGVNV